jgi:hypothetical protein
MAVTNRGSILISTANDIGSSLVDVIGGEGYTPNEWSKEINICGIAASDIPTALENIEESTPSGTDRGSISLDTANEVGAVLNKKYNTARGFKPSEWASAISFLEPLPERTASGGIANIQDGADKVPVKSWQVTIPPTLSGVSSLTEAQTGKTIFYPMDVEQGTISGSGYNSNSTARIRTADRKAVTPSTEYKIKVNSEVQIYEVHEYTDLTGSSTHLTVNASEYTFTTKSTTNYLRILFRYSNNATIRPSAITELQVTDGKLYWKTYTASLGRTIHGGTADIVNGEGTEIYSAPWIWTAGMSGVSVNNNGVCYINKSDVITVNASNQTTLVGCKCSDTSFESRTWAGLQNSSTNGCACVYGNGIAIRIAGYTTKQEYETYLTNNPLTFIYMLKTPTDFNFDSQEVDTLLGVNNFWSDEGDSSVVYRADIDSPEPSNLLGLSNSNNNIEEEGNI